jgi:GTPase SAR1 family protein
LKDVIFYFNNLKLKMNFIRYFHEKQIDYLDVNNINVNQNDTQQSLKVKLFQKYRNASIFCSNDYLWQKKRDQHGNLLSQFEKKRMENYELNYVYADFSYSSYDLIDFDILNSEENKNTNAFSIPKVKIPLKTESTINVLLFGESGVGKSTFINAFANYLLYENIDQARSREPVAVIPVSFLVTIDDQFTEKLINFGHQDPNEKHNSKGQSVTQQCKSYEFKTRDGKILKIIDTPGFNDSRGQNQDEKNLNKIFSFIQNQPHLNALCILLKPNVKELNPSFRTSFIQLLHHLGDQFSNNIFFCFTNSRSTLTFGDTGPVLKRFLQTTQQNQIQMDKENTFCFDNKSFRYLVASQYSIEFNQQFTKQCEQSWAKSVKESNRLLDQICLQEKQYNIYQKWISIKQIKQQIIRLIRPLLEAMRNISRNILLTDTEFFKRSILLIPSSIHSSKSICYRSHRPYKTFGPFNIMNDYIHALSDPCPNEHLITNYKLDYELGEKQAHYSSADVNVHLFEIIKVCAHFDYFLKDDYQPGPFLTGINRMINEEKVMSEQVQSNNLNEKLSRRLHKCKEQYTKDFDGINLTDEYLYLKSIYSRIETIKQMPMIYEQLNPT